MHLPSLIGLRLHQCRERINLAVGQPGEQSLLAQRCGIVEMLVPAIAIDDLVFGPLGRFVEHGELTQFR
jgi:hypothetical protein